MGLRFAVILSGAGNRDGSEIHESVASLLAITKVGGTYQCFAPNVNFQEVDYITNQLTGKMRNALAESARIARGDIQDLSKINIEDFDILVIPGGLGAVKVLSDFYDRGVPFNVNNDVAKAIRGFHNKSKPIVALCIAPVILPAVIGGAKVTIGNDVAVSAEIETMGGVAQGVDNPLSVVIDEQNKIISNPCYMLAENVEEVFDGAMNAIKAACTLVS